jgi:hypothetical protein
MDPFDIGQIWQKMYRKTNYYGRQCGPAFTLVPGASEQLDLFGVT